MKPVHYGLFTGLLSTSVFIVGLWFVPRGSFVEIVWFVMFMFILIAGVGFVCIRYSRMYDRKDRTRFVVVTFGVSTVSLVVIVFFSFFLSGDPLTQPMWVAAEVLGFAILDGATAAVGSASGGYVALRYSKSRSSRVGRIKVKLQDFSCPRCGFQNPLGFGFCGQCGTALADTTRVY